MRIRFKIFGRHVQARADTPLCRCGVYGNGTPAFAAVADPGICVRGAIFLPLPSPAAKRFLVNCRLKIAPVVAMVTKYSKKRNTLSCTSITTYHLLCNGTQKLQCCCGKKGDVRRRMNDTKSNTSVVLRRDFFRL